MKCKNCNSTDVVKNGVVRGKQRYRCKKCKCNFTEGDGRKNQQLRVLKAALFIINSVGVMTSAEQVRLLNRDRALIFRLTKKNKEYYKSREKPWGKEYWKYDDLKRYLRREYYRFNLSKPVFIASAKMLDRDDEYSFVFIMQKRIKGSDRLAKVDSRRTRAALFMLYALNIVSGEMSGELFSRELLPLYRPKDIKDLKKSLDRSVRDRHTSRLDYSELGDYIEKNSLLYPSISILVSSETMTGGYLLFLMQRKSVSDK